MTVKGRTLKARQHRVGGKLDPDVHGVRFYPTAPVPKQPEIPDSRHAEQPTRPGAAERRLVLDLDWNLNQGDWTLSMHTEGWYPSLDFEIDERQARFLRDTLLEWFPPE